MSDYKSIFDSLSDVIFIHDEVTAEVLYVNGICQEVYGYSPKELMTGGLELLSIDEGDFNMNNALKLIHKAAKGTPQVFEWKTKRKDGTSFWVEVQLNAIKLDEHKRVIATVRDITAKHEAKKNLERKEQLQKALNLIIHTLFAKNNEKDILWSLVDSCVEILSLDDLVVYVKTAENKLEQRAAYGSKVDKNRNIINPLVLNINEGIVGKVASKGKSILIEDVSKTKDYIKDDKKRLSELAVPIMRGNEIIGVIDSEHPEVGFYSDEHVEILEAIAAFAAVKIIEARAVHKMKNNEARMQAILEASPDLIFIIDKDGTYLEAYTANEELLAAPKSELIGTKFDQYLSSEEATVIKGAIINVIKTGVSEVHEYLRKSKNGSIKWFSSKMSRLSYEGKDAIILLSRDITKNKLIQKRVEESERLLTSINHNITDGIYRSYPYSKLAYVNQAFASMFGYGSVRELKDQNPDSLYANPDDRKLIIQLIQKKGQINNEEVQFRKKDGSVFWGALSSTLTKNSEGQPVIDGAIRDITESKVIQKSIHENQKLLESINRNISEGIYRSYAKGGLIYANNSFARMFGYDSPEDIMAVKSLSLYAKPSDRKGATPSIQQIGYVSNNEVEFKRKDGSTFWGLNSYILTTNEDGEMVFDGAVRDISLQKEAEDKLNKLNIQLLERNKTLALKEKELETSNEELIANSESLVQTLDKLSDRNFELDQLVYRTSHDLRAPLRSVLGLTNLMRIDDEDSTEEFLEKIDERILKMDDFIKAMLDYSRASRMGIKVEEVDFKQLIHDCLEDLKYLEGFEEMEINTNYHNGLSKMNCDRLRSRIIFGNIISNAYKYRDVNKKRSYLQIDVDIQEDEAYFTFKDNGIGISAKYIDKIFEMFFRATEKSDGSGLGMYIVKQSVDKIGGEIDVKSRKGQGTTIEIVAPCR